MTVDPRLYDDHDQRPSVQVSSSGHGGNALLKNGYYVGCLHNAVAVAVATAAATVTVAVVVTSATTTQ